MSTIASYRVWSKSEEKFLPPNEVAIMPNGQIVRYSCQDKLAMKLRMGWLMKLRMGWLAYNNTDNYIVQKYAGIQDKDSNPIYVGDIVQCGGLIYEIKEETLLAISLHLQKRGERTFGNNEEDIQIVGNIFINPKLVSDSNS